MVIVLVVCTAELLGEALGGVSHLRLQGMRSPAHGQCRLIPPSQVRSPSAGARLPPSPPPSCFWTKLGLLVPPHSSAFILGSPSSALAASQEPQRSKGGVQSEAAWSGDREGKHLWARGGA